MAINQDGLISTGSYVPDDWTDLGQVFDSALSSSLGIVWRGVTGTVDPFTKAGTIRSEAAALAQASQRDVSATDVTQAEADVTQTLKANNADPSQASFLSNNPGLQNFLEIATKLSYVLAAVAIGYVVVKVAEAAKAVA